MYYNKRYTKKAQFRRTNGAIVDKQRSSTMQCKPVLEAAINSDPTATPEEKARLLAALQPAAEKQPRMITRKAVAALLGVHEQTVCAYVRRGLLLPRRLTKRAVRYSEEEVLNFLQHGARA